MAKPQQPLQRVNGEAQVPLALVPLQRVNGEALLTRPSSLLRLCIQPLTVFLIGQHKPKKRCPTLVSIPVRERSQPARLLPQLGGFFNWLGPRVI